MPLDGDPILDDIFDMHTLSNSQSLQITLNHSKSTLNHSKSTLNHSKSTLNHSKSIFNHSYQLIITLNHFMKWQHSQILVKYLDFNWKPFEFILSNQVEWWSRSNAAKFAQEWFMMVYGFASQHWHKRLCSKRLIWKNFGTNLGFRMVPNPTPLRKGFPGASLNRNRGVNPFLEISLKIIQKWVWNVSWGTSPHWRQINQSHIKDDVKKSGKPVVLKGCVVIFFVRAIIFLWLIYIIYLGSKTASKKGFPFKGLPLIFYELLISCKVYISK